MSRLAGRGARLGLLALLAGGLVLGMGSGASLGSGSTVVSVSIPSSTSLDTTGCMTSTTATNFGIVSAPSLNVTADPCSIEFGSSNDTASLRVRQTDARNTAMVSENTWSASRKAPSSGSFTDIEAGSAANIWAVGTGGLAASSDGAENWTYPAAGVTVALTGVTAWSATGAVAVGSGGVIRRTADGSTWGTVTSPVPGANFIDVDSSGAGGVYAAAGNGVVIVSSDGGATFVERSIAPLTTATVSEINVIDDQTAWATAGNEIYRTTDAGLTWVLRYAGCTGVIRFVATSAAEALGLVYGTCPGAPFRVRTTDGGATWSQHSGYHGTNSWIGGYELIQPGTIVAYRGGTAPISHQYYISTDGGINFSGAQSPPERGLTAIAGMDAVTPTKWVTADSLATITATTNGGTNWAIKYTGTDQPLSAIDRSPDGSEYWSVGGHGVILRSTNEGANWVASPNPNTSNLRGVVALGSGDAVAVGDGGAIYRTDDGGVTWTTPNALTSNNLHGIARVGQTSTLYAVGRAGTIRRSSDLGVTWATVASGTGTHLNAVTSDGVDIWAVGDGGLIRRSNNDGASWTTFVAGGVGAWSLVSAHSPARGVVWIGGMGGRVATTKNAGATWSSWALGGVGTSGQYGMYAFSAEEAVTIDDHTRQHRTWDGGATWSEMNVAGKDIVSISSNRFLVVRSDAYITEYGPQFAVADYAFGTNGWGQSTSMFGACLDSVGNGAFLTGASWVPNPGCASSDAGVWNPIGSSNSLIAHAPLGTADASANLFFGLRVSQAQRSGKYVAPITFEVVAPDA